MKHSIGKRIVALALILMLCLGAATEVFAANVCGQIGGNSNGSVSFQIKTGKRVLFSDKVTFTQDKGVLNYMNWIGTMKTMKAYDTFTIQYTKVGSTTTKTAKMDGGSCTIKLDANSTYNVKVTPASNQTLQWRYFIHGAIFDWKVPATWRIKSTKGIELCEP